MCKDLSLMLLMTETNKDLHQTYLSLTARTLQVIIVNETILFLQVFSKA